MNKIIILFALMIGIIGVQQYNSYKKDIIIEEILVLAEDAVDVFVLYKQLNDIQEMQIKKLKLSQCVTIGL